MKYALCSPYISGSSNSTLNTTRCSMASSFGFKTGCQRAPWVSLVNGVKLGVDVVCTCKLHGLSAAKFTQDPPVWLMRSGGKVRALAACMLAPLILRVLSLCSPFPSLSVLLWEWLVMSSTSSCEVQALVGCLLASSPLDSLAAKF